MAYVKTPEEQQDEQQTNAVAPIQTGAGQGVSIGGTTSTPSGQKASSGRFTNIQKYLGANQQAGQEIAGNVSQQLGKNVQENQQQAQDTQKAAQTGIDTATQTLQRGQGYQSELGGDANNSFKNANMSAMQSFDPNAAKLNQAGTIFDTSLGGKFQSFAGDTNKLTDLTKFRFGANVDEAALNAQGASAQNAANVLQNKAAQEKARTADEQGRFGLVKQTFARPNYTAGQQRMDNVFFGTSGKAGIGQVQNVANQNINAANFAQSQANQQGSNIKDITANEQTLATDLTSATQGLKQSFSDMLAKRFDPTKKAFSDEIQRYNDSLGLLTRTPGTSIDPNKQVANDIWDNFALDNGQQTYNALTGKQLKDFATVNDLSDRPMTIQDVATQQDVDTMKSLQALSQSSLDSNGNLLKNYNDELTAPTTVSGPVVLNTGDTSMRGQVDSAAKAFLDQALGTTLTGRGSDTYRGAFGLGGGTEVRESSANVGNLLNQAGFQASGSGDKGVVDPITGLFTGVGRATGLQNLLDGVGGAINTIGGSGQSGAARAAQIRSQQDLQAKIDSYLQTAGFGNAVSRGGQLDTTSYTNQMRAAKAQADKAISSISEISGADKLNVNSSQQDIMDALNAGHYAVNENGTPVLDESGNKVSTLDPEDLRNNINLINKSMQQQRAAAASKAATQDQLNQLFGQKPGQVNTQVEKGAGPAMTLAEALAAQAARGR
jgi:hypothetical protein